MYVTHWLVSWMPRSMAILISGSAMVYPLPVRNAVRFSRLSAAMRSETYGSSSDMPNASRDAESA